MTDDTKKEVANVSITLEQLITMEPALGTVSSTRGLPTKVAYRLSRLVARLKPELETYNEERAKIIKELGEVQEDGSTYKIPDGEKLDEFNKRHKELLSETIEFTLIKPTIDELAAANLSPTDFFHLEPIIVPED